MTGRALSAATGIYAVLGDPVAHSLSPEMQNAAFEAAGVDGAYVALRCPSSRLEGLVRGLAEAGGGGTVTLPHKGRVAALVEDPEPSVVRTGACNTFWAAGGRLRGANTDVDGVAQAIAGLLGGPPSGALILLLGAGGAARAAALAALDGGADRVLVSNRTRERAEALVAAMADSRIEVAAGEGGRDGAVPDLLINATSLGLHAEDPLPVSLEGPAASTGAVLDLVYRRGGATPLVQEARLRGIPSADGREMLVHQGAAAFERWWGRPAPIQVMRDALERAVALR